MPSFLSINTPPEGGLDSLGLAHLSAGFEAGKTPKCGCVMPLLMISRHRETWRDWLLPQAPGFSRGVMTDIGSSFFYGWKGVKPKPIRILNSDVVLPFPIVGIVLNIDTGGRVLDKFLNELFVRHRKRKFFVIKFSISAAKTEGVIQTVMGYLEYMSRPVV